MAPTPRRIPRSLIAILLLALILRLALALSLPADDSVFWDESYRDYARNFSQGNGFHMASPYRGELGITRVRAFRSPLFPFLWGCVYRLTRGAYAPIRATHALLGALSCALAYLIARQITPRKSITLVTALLCALYPPLIWHSVHLMTEPLFICLSLAAVYSLLRCRRTRRWRPLIAAGIAAGLATLTRSMFAGFLPCMAIWLYWSHPRKKTALLRVALVTAIVTAVMAPWIIRNALVLRAFVPATTDAGHGFYAANNPRALTDPRGWAEPPDWGFILHPGETSLSEVQASRRLSAAARTYLLANPRTALRLMARRFLAFWRFSPHRQFVPAPLKRLVYTLAYVPVFLLMLPGAWRLHRNPRSRLHGLLLIDLLIVYTVAVHTIVLAIMRYRVPLMPFLLLFAAAALTAALPRTSLHPAPTDR